MKSLVRMAHPRAGVAAAFVVAFVVLVFAAAPALAVAPTFSTAATFAVGDSPHAVATGDFNGDGKIDVATASHTGATVSVLLGLGNGKLGAAKSVTVGLHPSAIVAADFNGDGKLDLAVANSGSNTVSILRGNGAGGFTLVQIVTVGAGPMQMASGDLNGDGRLDLAVTCYTGATISKLQQNSAGVFVATTLPVPTLPTFSLEGPRAIAIADADNDGNLDIIFTSYFRHFGYDDTVEDLGVYYGDGTGGFDNSADFSYVSVPDGVMDLAVADINGDGKTEIVGASWTADQVWIATEGGSHTRDFSAPDESTPAFVPSDYPGALIVKDFNGDGIPDIAVSLPRKNEIEISLSRWRVPCWSLAAKWKRWQLLDTIAAGDGAGPMVAADMNGDGSDDFVVGDYGSDRVAVLAKTWPLRSGAAFEPPVLSSVGSGTEFTRMATGDLDDSGALDVVSTQNSYLGTNGNSAAQPTAPTDALDAGSASLKSGSGHTVADDVALADVNHDGMLDLVSAETGGNAVTVALGTGAGAFGTPASYATGTGPMRVLVADVNGDGAPDIVTSNNTAGTVSVLLGDGTGAFGAHADTTVGTAPLGIAAGDFNRDGKLDLVVADNGGTTVSILLGDGTGVFARTTKTVGAQPAAVGLGDFNRDGKLDLVVGTTGGDVSVLPGDGSGAFGTAVTVTSPAGATELAIADFSTDGVPDVAATTPHAGGTYGVTLLTGNGSGGLVVKKNLTVPGNTITGLTAADMSGDGVTDLVVGSYDPAAPATGRVYEFVNDTIAPATDPHLLPVVHITGGGGTGATATCVVQAGKILAVVPVNGGSGYTSAPTVTITGGWGSGATAHALVGSGQVTRISLTNRGSGYASPVQQSSDIVDGPVYWLNHSLTASLASSDDGAGMAVPPATWFQYKTSGFVKGVSPAITAPASHSADGIAALRPYSSDTVVNAEDWWPWRIGIDTVKPVMGDDAASGWTKKAVTTVALTASDALSDLPQSSAIRITGWGFSVATGASSGSATVLVPAPYDHANDGVHAITFQATDNAGNTGSKTFYVRIDTVRPTLTVPAALKTRAGGFVTLKYRVNDGSVGCGAATVKLIIRNARGAKVASWGLGTAKTNKTFSFAFPVPGARGTYTCTTYATDLAGNVQQQVGLTKLTLR